MTTRLCDVTSLSERSCCDPPAGGEPGLVTNPPGQGALRYRVGTFATFRRALLAAIPERLPQWTDLSHRNYGVVLLEMWAMLADILTFYQERIANEAFLRTAVLRESVVRLAALVDYRLNPGAAANAYLAFTGDKGRIVDLPQGFRAQTRPAPGAPPVPFETDEPLTVYASLNRMRVRSLQPQSLGFGDREAILQGVKTGLRPGDRILIVGQERLRDAGSERWEVRRVSQVLPDKSTDTTRIVWQEPLGHRLPRVEPPASPHLHALRLQTWPFGYNAPDYESLKIKTTQVLTPTGGTATTVETTSTPALSGWTGKKLPEDPKHPEYIFLDTLYPTIAAGTWVVLITSESVKVPEGANLVEKTYEQGYAEAYWIRQVDETVHAGYTLTSKVTRLTVDTVKQKRRKASGKVDVTQPENLDIFPMQGTSVLAQSERLTLAQVPVTEPVAGHTITLDAVYADLKPGRLLVLTGREPDGREARTEVVRVKEVRHGASETVVTLATYLRHAYDPATLTIHGNVAGASHGETVADEILGSGDAGQLFQSFTLKQGPLTFLRAAGRDANRWGTRAALEIRVGGVRWNEREHWLDSGPSDRDYLLTIGADDEAIVTFGGAATGEGEGAGRDTMGGARLPTRRDNVRARYRKGLGTRGNVAAGAVSTLVSSAPGLKFVTNPLPGTGGADREREDAAKVNVPATMRAFDRAVSVEDYSALARTFAGVAKARSFWERRDPADPSGRRRLEQPRIHLTVAATDRTPPLQPAFRAALRGFLDARRDPNQPLVIADFTPISVDLTVKVEPEPDLLPENVLAAVAAALSAGRNPDGTYGLFAFERLDFGLSLHLSDIYAAVQGVPGVRAALVTRFRHRARAGELEADIPPVETHIFIRNTELLRCDNDPADPSRGLLELSIAEVSTDGA